MVRCRAAMEGGGLLARGGGDRAQGAGGEMGSSEETRERDREMGIRSGLGLRRCVGTRGESGRARVRKGLGGLDLQANGPA